MWSDPATVAARNFLRMIAAGTAAHSDHARGMAFTLLAVATGEAKDFKITDVRKLYRVADTSISSLKAGK